MTQSGRRALRKWFLVALLLFGGALWGLRTQQAADGACDLLREELPRLTGLTVGINRCELEPLTQTLRLQGVSLFEEGEEVPLVAADEARVSLGRVDPLFGSLELDDVRLLRPRVNLDLSRPGTGTEGGCSLEVLRQVRISRLEVRNAEVRILLPGGRRVELGDGDVTWRRRRGRAEIQITSGKGRVAWREGAEWELSALAVDARFDPDREKLEVTRAEAALDALSFAGSGEIQDLCDPDLALEASLFVPLATVARVVRLPQPVAGHVWTHAAVEGPLKNPTVTLTAAGRDLRVGRYVPGGFDARVTVANGRARIEELETSAGAGTVRAHGTVELEGRWPVSLEVETDRAEFGPLLARAGLPGSWVDFPATGRFKAWGQLLPLHLEGSADLETGRFRMGSHAWDAVVADGRMILEFERARVQGLFSVLPDRVELRELVARSPGSELHADVVLHYAKEAGLEVEGELAQADFDEFGHLFGIHWAGKGTGRFSVRGPYANVTAQATLSLRDFDFWKMSLGVVQGRVEYANRTLRFPALTGQKGRTQYAGSAELVFPRGGGPFWSRGEVRIASGRVEDLVDALLPMHPNMDHFDGVLDGAVAGSFTVDSPSDAFAGVLTLDLAELRYFERRLGAGRMRLRFEDGEVAVLEPLVLEGPLGVTRAEGTWHFDGPLDYRFRVDGRLAEVLGPDRAQDLELEADLSLVGKVGGDTTQWTVTSWLTSPSVRLGGKDLGPAHLEGRLWGRDLQVWGRPFDGASVNLKMRVKTPYPFEVSGRVALPQIRPLLPDDAITQGLSGAVAGDYQASGNLKDARSVEGRATVDSLTLSRRDFSGRNDGPIELSWKAGRLSVDHFRFKGPNTLLTVAGAAGPRSVDLDLHGSLDMRLLESFVSDLERSSGRVELTAAARGTVDQPTLAGTASVTDARLSLRDLPLTVRGLSGRVEFSEARVLLQDVRGVLNDGRMEVEGDIRLTRFTPRDLQLRVLLDSVSYRPVEYLPLTASGELLLYGKPQRLTLAGTVDVDKLRYDQPLVLESLLADLQSGRVGTPREGPKDPWLAFDVRVNASGDVRVDNNLARARLKGSVRLTGTNVQPGLLGTIEAQSGSEIFFRGNTFNVSQALLEFKDRRDIDPVFDLHAQTLVREYAINLHGFGRLKDPQILLSSDPDLPEADILSLLTLGVTSRDQSGDGLGTGGYLFTEAIFNASGLDRQVQRFLPKNPVLRDLSFHISSGYNEASGAVEPMAHFESTFLTQQLGLEMTQPMISTKGTRARAEYRFDERLSGQLQWDNDRSENLPNFGVDLKLRWEVE